MNVRRIIGRFAAAVVGLVAVVIGLLINLFYSGFHDLFKAFFGGDTTLTHGWIGLALMLVAFVGVLFALFRPRFAAALFAIGGLGFIYPLGAYAVLPTVLLVIAALLAFLDRSPAKAKTPASVEAK